MTDDVIEIQTFVARCTMQSEGKGFVSEHVEENDTECQYQPSPVMVKLPCQNCYHSYLEEQEDGGKIDGREPFFRGSRNFPLGKIEQKDGNQSPGIVLFDGLKNHGARV